MTLNSQSEITCANLRTPTKAHDQDYAIDKVASSHPNGLVLDMTTDIMGNIINASGSVGGTPLRRYAYDALYRLTRVDNASDVMLEDYDYNKTGDRTQKALAGQAAQAYGYGASNHRLTSVAGVPRSYDANGNTLTLPNIPYPAEYDDRNRLASVTQNGLGSTAVTRYTHNGKGERVRKLSAGNDTTTQNFVYDESGRLLRDRADRSCGGGTTSRVNPSAGLIPCGGNRTVELLYLDDTPVAQITDGVISYLETDHLGTPRVAANPTNNTWQWKWNFFGDAFGGNAAESASSGGIEVNLRYPGQQFDAESGLHYNYIRDYEAGTGRYVESDPIGLIGGIATYGYVGGQALAQTDRFGLCWSNADGLVHFMFGLGQDVSIEQIGCSSQLGAATASHRAIWKATVGATARARASSMRCGSFSRLNVARSVGASSGIFWIGGFSLSQRGNCVVQRHCGSSTGNICRPDSFSFECLLTSRMNDLFVDPTDFNDGPNFYDHWNDGGTPFHVTGYWDETISGDGPL